MNLNKVFVLGNLVEAPELRQTPTGQSVATFRVATNRIWNDKAGAKQEATEYHTIVAWGRTAEIANQYLQKGAMVLIEGRIQTRSWDDKATGARRYKTEIVCERLQLGPRPMGSQGQGMRATSGMGSAPASSGIPDKVSDPLPVEEMPTIDLEEAGEVKPEDLPF